MKNNELTHWGIKGQKWGVRRYENADGTLTAAGKKRYDRDQRENQGKKKGDRVGTADPNRWVKEDITRTKQALDDSERMTRDLDRLNRATTGKTKVYKMDLSNMSDKEMRDQINRAMLERQYNDMFAPKKVNKGREVVSKSLEIGGAVLATAATALSIALSIKQLKG